MLRQFLERKSDGNTVLRIIKSGLYSFIKLLRVASLRTKEHKILLLGPHGSGKSSLLLQHATGRFTKGNISKPGLDVREETFHFPETDVELRVIEFGGTEAMSQLESQFYQGARFVILVYDMSDRDTFREVAKWYELIYNSVCIPTRSFIPGALVANKTDLKDERVITFEEGKQMADIFSWKYFETSSVTGSNVAELFIYVAAVIARGAFAA